MPDKKKAREDSGQKARNNEPAARAARRQRLCKYLHAAGPRPIMEALIAVENGQPLDDVLEDFARVPSSFYRILAASSFARIRAIITRSST